MLHSMEAQRSGVKLILWKIDLPSLSFSRSLYMPPFHISDVSKSLYSDCSPLDFDSAGYFLPSGFKLLNGYLEANISTF